MQPLLLLRRRQRRQQQRRKKGGKTDEASARQRQERVCAEREREARLVDRQCCGQVGRESPGAQSGR